MAFIEHRESLRDASQIFEVNLASHVTLPETRTGKFDICYFIQEITIGLVNSGTEKVWHFKT